MQIKKVAQGCRLGNQAECIPIPLINTNHQKNSIVENISRSTIVHIGASTRLGERGESPDFESVERCMASDSLASMFYWTIYKRGDTEGKTLMGRSHTTLQQYGLILKAIFNDIFRINNKPVIYEQ